MNSEFGQALLLLSGLLLLVSVLISYRIGRNGGGLRASLATVLFFALYFVIQVADVLVARTPITKTIFVNVELGAAVAAFGSLSVDGVRTGISLFRRRGRDGR